MAAVTTDPADKLASLLRPASLRRLAGERSFERGEDYFDDGAVRALRRRDGAVTAIVRGTYDYRVELRLEGAGLAHDCSCPRGDEGEFC